MQKTFCALAGITAIIASLSSGPISADTEFEDSIPIDLARSLLRGVGSPMDVKIYSDIPDYFPAFDVPDAADRLRFRKSAGSQDSCPALS